MGLEGIVSKHRDRTYKAGRSTDWIKVKNPGLPATIRAKDEDSLGRDAGYGRPRPADLLRGTDAAIPRRSVETGPNHVRKKSAVNPASQSRRVQGQLPESLAH
jgi:hypothetical protein